MLPATGQQSLGTTTKDNHQGDWHCRHCLNQNNARRFRPLAELHVSLCETFRPSPNITSLDCRARRARASCSRESLISAGPACSNTCYRVSLRLLAETSVAAEGGLWKGVHSGKNCILVYNAKAVLPPVSGSCEPYFCPNSVSC